MEGGAWKNIWEKAIKRYGGSDMLLYSDGIQEEDGRLGKGWYSPDFGG